MDSKQQVINHIQDGFQELYKSQHPTSIANSDFKMDWASALFKEDARLLSANITPPEICNALFSLKPYKAPRADGLHTSFFQHFWPTLGNSIIKEVQRIFAT